jgi:hypothetical protein
MLPLAATVFFLLVVGPQGTSSTTPQKEIRTDIINSYFKAPPDTLREMILQADLVVRGRLIGASPRDEAVKGGNRGTVTRTAYRLKIDEVLHTKDSKIIDASTIDIVRSGGDRDRGSHIQRSQQAGFPPFETGTDYLLFLVWNESLSAWVPPYGPDSAFDLRKGVVDSPGKAAVTNGLKGLPATDFLDRVRRFGG